ncbi:hypothetical protein STEG23_030177, partial [Scotinomys teguina]
PCEEKGEPPSRLDTSELAYAWAVLLSDLGWTMADHTGMVFTGQKVTVLRKMGIVDQQASPRIALSFVGASVTFSAKGLVYPIFLFFWRSVVKLQLSSDPGSIALIIAIPKQGMACEDLKACFRNAA